MAASSPARAYDDGDDDDTVGSEPAAPDAQSFEGHMATTDSTMYGQFTWTVALPAAPADKDSLADISKIRQFRLAPCPAANSGRNAALAVGPRRRTLRVGCVHCQPPFESVLRRGSRLLWAWSANLGTQPACVSLAAKGWSALLRPNWAACLAGQASAVAEGRVPSDACCPAAGAESPCTSAAAPREGLARGHAPVLRPLRSGSPRPTLAASSSVLSGGDCLSIALHAGWVLQSQAGWFLRCGAGGAQVCPAACCRSLGAAPLGGGAVAEVGNDSNARARPAVTCLRSGATSGSWKCTHTATRRVIRHSRCAHPQRPHAPLAAPRRGAGHRDSPRRRRVRCRFSFVQSIASNSPAGARRRTIRSRW